MYCNHSFNFYIYCCTGTKTRPCNFTFKHCKNQLIGQLHYVAYLISILFWSSDTFSSETKLFVQIKKVIDEIFMKPIVQNKDI